MTARGSTRVKLREDLFTAVSLHREDILSPENLPDAEPPFIADRPTFRPPLRIGYWPGASFTHNSMIRTLCDALERRGATIVDVTRPWRLHPKDIDLLHIHWPEQVFWSGGGHLRKAARITLTLAALARLRSAGVRVVWMVHNVRPHDAGAIKLLIWRLYVLGLKIFTQQYITLSPMTVPVVRRFLRLSRKAVVVSVRHPSYPGGSSRQAARARLGIAPDLRVYVFFGAIRPYKGIDSLLKAFEMLDDASARLIIAGEPSSPTVRTTLDAKAKRDPRIDLRLGYALEDTLMDIIDAADCVVLPFVDYLHSGSLIRALSQGKATITPETPFALDLRDELGEQWLRLYRGDLTSENLGMEFAPEGAPDMTAHAPDQVAEELIRCYRTIIEGG